MGLFRSPSLFTENVFPYDVQYESVHWRLPYKFKGPIMFKGYWNICRLQYSIIEFKASWEQHNTTRVIGRSRRIWIECQKVEHFFSRSVFKYNIIITRIAFVYKYSSVRIFRVAINIMVI